MTMMTKSSGVPLDVKELGSDGVIEGYGSIFGNVDSYGEIVMPGAFEASLAKTTAAGRKIKMLWQHDTYTPIGVWDELKEDKKGLRCKGRLLIDASAQAREAYELIKAGALEGLSIGYRVVKEARSTTKPNVTELLALDLKEISPVTFAANERAMIDTVKHLVAAGEMPSVREFEAFLRDAGGWSRAKAAHIASLAAPCLRGEPDGEASERLKRFYDALQG